LDSLFILSRVRWLADGMWNTQSQDVRIRWIKTKWMKMWTLMLPEIKCLHNLKWHRLLRNLETSNWSFLKLCCSKYKVNLSQIPEYSETSILRSKILCFLQIDAFLSQSRPNTHNNNVKL
jgi:hypothetical protein